MGARRMRGPAQDIGNNTQALRDFRNYAVTAHAALARMVRVFGKIKADKMTLEQAAALRSARCVLTPQSEDDE
jgi:predicted acyltransferase (DUF342 family)